MSDNLSDELKRMIADDSASYRDKWQAWKTTLYGSILTSNTLLVAICPIIIDPKCCISRYILATISISAIISSILIVLIMRQTCAFYDHLGFGPDINTVEDLRSEKKTRQQTLERWSCLGRIRRKMEICAEYLTLAGLILLAGYAVVFINGQPHCQ